MAQILKVLGQSFPAATTWTQLYVVPALTSTVVSTLNVANGNASIRTFYIAVDIGGSGAPPAPPTQTQEAIAFGVSIDGNSVYPLTLGITLATTDKIWVYASAQDLSFNLFGTEVS